MHIFVDVLTCTNFLS